MEMRPQRRRPVRRRARRRRAVWGALGVIALALALRLPFVGARSLWFDEAFSWRLIHFFPSGEFFTRAAADVHPILYYVLLWAWVLPVRAFAAARGNAFEPEVTLVWMRLFSVFLSVLTVAGMTVAGRILFRSAWTGTVAGLLAAVSAFQVQYAWEARMYTLGTALLPFALASLVRAVHAPTARRAWRSSLRLGVILGALLHVHYYALFSWAAVGGAKLLFFLRAMRRGVVPVLRAPQFRAAETGFWLSALLFLPWVPVFLQQVQRVEQSYWIPRFSAWSVPYTITRIFWGGVSDIPPQWAAAASVAALLVVLVPLLRGRTFGDVVAACAFVVPLALAVAVSLRPRSVYVDRYFIFASLGLLLLVARLLSLLPLYPLQRFRAWRWLTLRGVVVAVVAMLGLASTVRFWITLDFPAHPGARGAATFLRAHAEPEEPIVVSSSFAYFPISFHLGCQIPPSPCQDGYAVRLYSETGTLAFFSGGPILVPKDLIGPEIFGPTPNTQPPTPKGRVWVVDTTGFGGSRLTVPREWVLTREEHFREVFDYQGEITVRSYARADAGARSEGSAM